MAEAVAGTFNRTPLTKAKARRTFHVPKQRRLLPLAARGERSAGGQSVAKAKRAG
jgi:hypothetical protein